MIPQIGFAEMLVLVVLAIIVVGPKDLPKLMRSIGQFMARIRSMGQEFRSAFDDMAKETEMDELRREIRELKQLGELGDIDENDFLGEVQKIDNEIRESTDLSNPKSHS